MGHRGGHLVTTALGALLYLGCAQSVTPDAGPRPVIDGGPARAPRFDGGGDVEADGACGASRVTTYWREGAHTFLARDVAGNPLHIRAAFSQMVTDAGLPVLTFAVEDNVYEVADEDGVIPAGGVDWRTTRGSSPRLAWRSRVRSDENDPLFARSLYYDTRLGVFGGLFGAELRQLRLGRYSYGMPAVPLRSDLGPAVPFRPAAMDVVLSQLVAFTEEGGVLAQITPGTFGPLFGFGTAYFRWCEDDDDEGRRPVVRGATVWPEGRPLPAGLADPAAEFPGRERAELWVERRGSDGRLAAHMARIADAGCLRDPVPLYRPSEVDPSVRVRVISPRLFTTVSWGPDGGQDSTVLIVEDGCE